MSIHFISGKPGGGKSLFGTAQLVRQLRETKRFIVTNLPINLELLQCYMDSLGSNIHVLSRVLLLDESEVPDFYRYRLGGRVGDAASGMPDYTAVNDEGVCYILDELHIFFNSRQWKNTGAGALFYLSQHRKLGDIVYCITQSINNVDKQFRSVAQDFTYCTNERIQKFGKFRKGNGFTWKCYGMPVTSGAEIPFEQGRFALDLDLASTYNTAGGVGTNAGGGADKGAKAKGPPLWVVWVVLPLGLALIYWVSTYGLKWAGGAAGSAITGKAGQAAAGESSSTLPPSGRPAAAGAAPQAGGGARAVEVGIEVVSYSVIGDRIRVRLSDGRTLTEQSQDLRGVGADWVDVRGVGRLWFVPAYERERPETTGSGGGGVALADGG